MGYPPKWSSTKCARQTVYVHVCTYGAIIKEEVVSLREWAGHRKKLAGDAGNDGCRYSTSV